MPENSNSQFKVCGLGEVLWDVFPEGEKLGGAPANFACHCKSLGADTYVVSCVGADKRGDEARRFLDEHGVDTSNISVSSEHETGVVLVTLDQKGSPSYEIKEGVAWDNIPWTDSGGKLAGKLDAVCFGSLCQRSEVSRGSIQRFLAAKRGDCLGVFDINLRQDFYSDEVIYSSLEYADVLKLNDEELPVVAGLIGIRGEGENVIKDIIKKFELRLAALTCGSKGALMAGPDESSFVEAPAVEVVSTVGAGDSFTAAMIMGFLRGDELEKINEDANRLAAFVCTQQGGVPKLPDSFTE